MAPGLQSQSCIRRLNC